MLELTLKVGRLPAELWFLVFLRWQKLQDSKCPSEFCWITNMKRWIRDAVTAVRIWQHHFSLNLRWKQSSRKIFLQDDTVSKKKKKRFHSFFQKLYYFIIQAVCAAIVLNVRLWHTTNLTGQQQGTRLFYLEVLLGFSFFAITRVTVHRRFGC